MDKNAFLTIIDSTPLVSIDIILKNDKGQVLLGYRNNKPAQGYWFVPGGRIRKNETLMAAMSRISQTELGFEIPIEKSKLLGAYDHIYDDNFQGISDINTHYVALGHEVVLEQGQSVQSDDQHSEIKWWSVDELLNSDNVHKNTKAYFMKDSA